MPDPIDPAATVLRLVLPLEEGQVACLYLPVPITAESYDYMIAQLQLMKRGVTAHDPKQPIPGP